MNRTIAVNRARFKELFEQKSWTGGNVIQKNVYMSKMEFTEVLVRHHLGQFLIEHKLNFRSPSYRFHIIMAPEIMDDEAFKQRVTEVMNAIGVATEFSRTCSRGESSFRVGSVVGRGHASEVELVEYCDVLIKCRKA